MVGCTRILLPVGIKVLYGRRSNITFNPNPIPVTPNRRQNGPRLAIHAAAPCSHRTRNFLSCERRFRSANHNAHSMKNPSEDLGSQIVYQATYFSRLARQFLARVAEANSPYYYYSRYDTSLSCISSLSCFRQPCRTAGADASGIKNK